MSSPRADTLWHVPGKQRLLFSSWNDDTAVVCYDTMSGDTHLLNAIAAETLVQLQQDTAPLRLDALASHVAASLVIQNDQELVSAIAQILAEFSERGVLAQT